MGGGNHHNNNNNGDFMRLLPPPPPPSINNNHLNDGGDSAFYRENLGCHPLTSNNMPMPLTATSIQSMPLLNDNNSRIVEANGGVGGVGVGVNQPQISGEANVMEDPSDEVAGVKKYLLNNSQTTTTDSVLPNTSNTSCKLEFYFYSSWQHLIISLPLS